jgi:hypothetical protein
MAAAARRAHAAARAMRRAAAVGARVIAAGLWGEMRQYFWIQSQTCAPETRGPSVPWLAARARVLDRGAGPVGAASVISRLLG